MHASELLHSYVALIFRQVRMTLITYTAPDHLFKSGIVEVRLKDLYETRTLEVQSLRSGTASDDNRYLSGVVRVYR